MTIMMMTLKTNRKTKKMKKNMSGDNNHFSEDIWDI